VILINAPGGVIARKNSDGIFVLGSEAQRIHPNDTGDPQEVHDFTLGVNALVWQPAYLAYMLINPANAGYSGRPAGFCVKDPPAAGQPEVDWAVIQLGGFYAFKYQASRADATSSAAGSSNVATSRQGVVPCANITIDDAAKMCYAAGDGGGQYHLMANREWMALAIYSQLLGPDRFGANRYGPFGNNNNGTDIDDPGITFTADPTQAGRALTGTGTKAGWAGGVNLTSHTGRTNGVYDLNGNVWEWVSGLTTRVGATGGQADTILFVDGVSTGLAIPGGASGERVTALLTKPIWREHGIPASTDATGKVEFGADGRWFSTSVNTEYVASRGGSWANGVQAGVFALTLYSTRGSVYTSLGVRAALSL